MPRRPNPDLEAKILRAAQKLWKKGGEDALTMRAVAEAAGTNTPSLYRRFRNRDDILRGLLEHIRLEIAVVIDAATSVNMPASDIWITRCGILESMNCSTSIISAFTIWLPLKRAARRIGLPDKP